MESTLRVQLPAKAKFGGFCRKHLATLATPTIRSIKCKQSLVYGVFWPLLPHSSTNKNKTRTWMFPSPRNLPIKFGTNPSTIFLVIVVTDRHTHRQTHKPTPVKTYSLAFAGRIKCISSGNDKRRPGPPWCLSDFGTMIRVKTYLCLCCCHHTKTTKVHPLHMIIVHKSSVGQLLMFGRPSRLLWSC